MKITIVIPCYNAAKTLKRALDSAVEQGADEVVVVDDCSTDGSYELACIYEGVRVLRHPEKSKDWMRAMEPVIEALDTDYVVCLAADDVLYPMMVACVRYARLEAAEPPGVIFCDFDYRTPEGKVIFTRRYCPQVIWMNAARVRSWMGGDPRRYECGVGAAIRHDLLVWLQREDYASLGPWSDAWGYPLAAIRAGAVYVPGPLAGFTVDSENPSYGERVRRDPAQCEKYHEAALKWLQRENIQPYARGIKFGM
jgi:glycosyltransferase involved in cell wall biosynthesis